MFMEVINVFVEVKQSWPCALKSMLSNPCRFIRLGVLLFISSYLVLGLAEFSVSISHIVAAMVSWGCCGAAPCVGKLILSVKFVWAACLSHAELYCQGVINAWL